MEQSLSATLYMARKMRDPKNSRHELSVRALKKTRETTHRMSYYSKYLVPRMNQGADHSTRDK